MIELFHLLLFDPLYNALVFILNIHPLIDAGIAVVLLTIAVKFILLPLSVKAIRTQLLMRKLEEPLKAIREEYKDKKEQAKKIMALYKEKGVNPFSSILLLFIQLPIIFALYWVFFKGGLPDINMDLLYSFIRAPSSVDMEFLGLVDVSQRSIVLALLAGVSQFFQAKLSLPLPPEKTKEPSFKNDLARSFHLQMRYVLPVIVAVIAYTISAAVALYWTTSNLFAIGQELLIKRRLEKKEEKHG
ncbi:MAG: YidC/Oxa1 family membrane protein insertase [Candidatus Paceibacterota bacterium]